MCVPSSYASTERHQPTGSRLSIDRLTILVTLVMIAALMVCRLWLAADLPLTDTTEARYAEMARKMVETGNWLMPQHSYGVPYLGKPPFAFWSSALGIKLLGANELAARLPILAIAVAFCTIYYFWLRALFDEARALAGVLILTSSVLFFISMAAVMTDMILTVCVGSGLIAFWQRYQGGGKLVEIVLYVAIGVGVLTKGPLAAVLILVPISAWALSVGEVATVWQRLAWLRGGALVAAIALPWYVAAEWHYPGFLEYFIIGEHFGRFLVPAWSGDLYGYAHHLPRGTIWLYFLLALLPWPVLLAPTVMGDSAQLREAWIRQRRLATFGVLWAATPLFLFTFSANIIWPYVLPALPGTVFAIVALLAPDAGRARRLVRLGWVAVAAITLSAIVLGRSAGFIEAHTKKQVVAAIESLHSSQDRPQPIYYWDGRYFSAAFYSAGRALELHEPAELQALLADGEPFSLIVRADHVEDLPETARARLAVVAALGDTRVLEPGRATIPAASSVSPARMKRRGSPR